MSLAGYLFDHAANFEQARETARLVQQVSKDLIDSKSKAFMQGAGEHDVMSLLGMCSLKKIPYSGVVIHETRSKGQPERKNQSGSY